MTKTEMLFQLALVGTGGIVGTASALLANYLTQRAHAKREDVVFFRTRKEDLASQLLTLVAWTAKHRNIIIQTGTVDDTDNPLLRVRIFIHLYFPHLIEDVETLEKIVNSIQTDCLNIYKGQQDLMVDTERFESLVPKTGALETHVDQMIEKLKTAPTLNSSVCGIQRSVKRYETKHRQIL